MGYERINNPDGSAKKVIDIEKGIEVEIDYTRHPDNIINLLMKGKFYQFPTVSYSSGETYVVFSGSEESESFFLLYKYLWKFWVSGEFNQFAHQHQDKKFIPVY